MELELELRWSSRVEIDTSLIEQDAGRERQLCDGMLAMFLTSSYLKISLNFDVLKLKIHFLVGLSVSVCHVEEQRVESSRSYQTCHVE